MKISIVFLLITASLSTYAQRADSVTNAELNRYAIMMDSVETLNQKRIGINNNLAKGNAKVTTSRYNLLLPIIDDQKKLTEKKATADEIAYVKKALNTIMENGQRFQNTFSSLMNDYVGEETYNKVKKAIANNPKVKVRYETELNRLKGIYTSKE